MVKLEIEKLLKEQNRSKYWLVKKLSTSYTVINNLVSGKTTYLKLEILEKLLFYLECEPKELITFIDEDEN